MICYKLQYLIYHRKADKNIKAYQNLKHTQTIWILNYKSKCYNTNIFVYVLTFGNILYFYLPDDDILNIETCKKLYIAYKIKIILLDGG